jgi:hypothetical protein
MPNKSKKKKSQRNRRQREVAEGLEAFEEQPPTSIGLTSTGVWIFSLPFALFFFLSNKPLSLHCSIRCPLAPACSICAPRQFTFFVFNSFRTERDHRCVYFLRRFFVFFQSNTLLFSAFRAHYFVLYSYFSLLPSCRAAAVPWKERTKGRRRTCTNCTVRWSMRSGLAIAALSLACSAAATPRTSQ